ncbi:hypothetical protein IWGMT90018_19310 [Mycobacterium kiyosense]|nr:hypothetical protein IWGMT90018_19310 [Mycobacterium kiyosense]
MSGVADTIILRTAIATTEGAAYHRRAVVGSGDSTVAVLKATSCTVISTGVDATTSLVSVSGAPPATGSTAAVISGLLGIRISCLAGGRCWRPTLQCVQLRLQWPS